MSSTNIIRNYKHDIAGKFKDISTALNAMDESAFSDPSNNEIFHAVHEVILKMVKTSRNTMIENLKQEMVLVVSDGEPDLNMPKLQIEGVVVRYEVKEGEMQYKIFLSENLGNPVFLFGKISASLPVKRIQNEISDQNNQFYKIVEEMNSSMGI
jgi:hypothetical protein